MIKDVVTECFDEACAQLKRKDVQDVAFEALIRPLAVYTASQLRIPLITIIVILFIFTGLLLYILFQLRWSK